MKPKRRFLAALTATTTIHAALAGALMHAESPEPASRKAEKIAMIDIKEPARDVRKPAAPSPKPPAPPKKKPAPPKKAPNPEPRPVPAPQPSAEPPAKPQPEPPKAEEAVEPKAPDTPPPEQKKTEAPAEPSAPSASTHRYEAAESYLGRLRQKIQAYLRYPMTARRLRLEGETLLRFVIRGDGTIGALALRRSSGHRTLDEKAVETVREAAPFEAPPQRKEMTILLPVSFNLERGG
jgi:protein TonB